MHANAALLHKLFTALHEHDPETMAACYQDDARFRDIAFSLRKRRRIHNMWRMICSDDVAIKVLECEVLDADDRAGRVRVVENYDFHTGKPPPKDKVPVTNRILSRFEFEDGKIRSQEDECDAKEWARQAMGTGIEGYLAGRIRLLRSVVANFKLARFVWTHRKQG
jgi:ketosteroid isomerase-like protein